MATEVSNQATVNYTYSGSSSVISENSNTAIVSVLQQNAISINKYTQSSGFVPGGLVTYFIDIENIGSQYFTGVRIIDELPPYLSYVYGTGILYYNGQALQAQVAATNPLTFTLSPLAGGNKMILSYTCRVSNQIPASVMELTNNVKGIGYAAVGEAVDTSSTTVSRSTQANLTITKSASASQVAINQVFSYSITLTNSGLSVANVESVTDNLPDNFQVSSITLKVGSSLSTLNPSDYTITAGNFLTIPSATGPSITVPASSGSGSGTTVVTITGFIKSNS